MWDSTCFTFLTCASFLAVCAFYGLSIAFLEITLRLKYLLSLTALIVVLDLADIGPHIWWSLLALFLFYILSEAFIPNSFRQVALPVELTSYKDRKSVV